jgi:nucleotide-binding universal stress UspA family protein
MRVPQTILVATDFSAHAEAALDLAISLADKLGAKITLLNVIGVPTLADVGVAVASTMIDRVIAENSEALDLLARRAAVPIDTQIKIGDARDTIVETAQALGADLIVMGTHGRRGLGRLALGSIAESVVRIAPCPVLTVRERVAA